MPFAHDCEGHARDVLGQHRLPDGQCLRCALPALVEPGRICDVSPRRGVRPDGGDVHRGPAPGAEGAGGDGGAAGQVDPAGPGQVGAGPGPHAKTPVSVRPTAASPAVATAAARMPRARPDFIGDAGGARRSVTVLLGFLLDIMALPSLVFCCLITTFHESLLWSQSRISQLSRVFFPVISARVIRPGHNSPRPSGPVMTARVIRPGHDGPGGGGQGKASRPARGRVNVARAARSRPDQAPRDLGW